MQLLLPLQTDMKPQIICPPSQASVVSVIRRSCGFHVTWGKGVEPGFQPPPFNSEPLAWGSGSTLLSKLGHGLGMDVSEELHKKLSHSPAGIPLYMHDFEGPTAVCLAV